ncbi:hypothetical protein PPEV_gp194 [Pseudomonas phage EL]|uniref:Uncharacterized protein n=1 Tax=Pseudomonas phage EL TaxID=273133 RepID=Q2Z0N7_9CAUD|nr:hypothetical protein PPEV_gp194 [Pseudomonas phage EL]CAG27288.1 hypothetical protein [Pseudomonas phage EL]
MSINKEYGEWMEKGVKGLVDSHDYNKATNHITFDSEKVELPKGVTQDSILQHVNFFNDISAQVETATSQIARSQFEDNKELTTVDGTLNLGGLNINSQHHLKQKVGEDYLWGQSTTAVDYTHTEEQAVWLDTQRTASQEQAAKLFE